MVFSAGRRGEMLGPKKERIRACSSLISCEWPREGFDIRLRSIFHPVTTPSSQDCHLGEISSGRVDVRGPGDARRRFGEASDFLGALCVREDDSGELLVVLTREVGSQ